MESDQQDKPEDDDDGRRWLKMAYKVDQCRQHAEKLKDTFGALKPDARFASLVESVKVRVPLCLCGAFFVHETSPIDFRCRHCFRLYDADKVVIHYCQQQRECQHFNSDYYLCNTCAMSLRRSAKDEGIKQRASQRLLLSIDRINAAAHAKQAEEEWKDVSSKVYYAEQAKYHKDEDLIGG